MTIAHKYLPNYTYEDYCQWEGRWELINGIPFAMAPMHTPIHQTINGNLYANFETALKKDCKAYLPIDWKIFDNTINFVFTFEGGCTADVDFEDIWD
jgi:Uma2 family endonuclease